MIQDTGRTGVDFLTREARTALLLFAQRRAYLGDWVTVGDQGFLDHGEYVPDSTMLSTVFGKIFVLGFNAEDTLIHGLCRMFGGPESEVEPTQAIESPVMAEDTHVPKFPDVASGVPEKSQGWPQPEKIVADDTDRGLLGS